MQDINREIKSASVSGIRSFLAYLLEFTEGSRFESVEDRIFWPGLILLLFFYKGFTQPQQALSVSELVPHRRQLRECSFQAGLACGSIERYDICSGSGTAEFASGGTTT